MAQFDVHKAKGPAARVAPYLVILQADTLDSLRTIIVAPMRPAKSSLPAIRQLRVEADFLSGPHVISPQEMVSLPRDALGAKAGSVIAVRPELTAAIDFLFYGF